MKLRIVLTVAALVLVLVVGMQNNSTVDLRFLFWSFDVNRLVLFLFLFLGGVIVGLSSAWIWTRRRAAKP